MLRNRRVSGPAVSAGSPNSWYKLAVANGMAYLPGLDGGPPARNTIGMTTKGPKVSARRLTAGEV